VSFKGPPSACTLARKIVNYGMVPGMDRDFIGIAVGIQDA
jgi:hypothetical protein